MHYINGLWKNDGSVHFTSLNPATGEEIWVGKTAGEAEIRAAVDAARAAFPAWAALPFDARHAYLTRFKDLIEKKKEELAVLIAQETGKVLWDARSEVAAVIAKITYATEAYHERTGTKSRDSQVGRATVSHRPQGVMAVYGPYNFPAHLPNGHIMPALLAGNTVVLKPSEQTPKTAEWMVKQWEAAGVPAGVLNLVQGEKETGILLSKAEVDGILFTGSSATGKALHAQLAGRPEVILALEMGGNNPLIVTEVADLRAAVHETLLSAFISTGQRCTCARRLIVVDWKGAHSYVNLLVESANLLKIGKYNDSNDPFMGPLISNKEADRLLEAQRQLQALGGKILLRMRRTHENLPFVTPCIIDMTGVSDIPDVEYFGPILQIYHVNNIESAIKSANATQYGLSASVFTDHYDMYQRIASRLHAGLINWNRQTTGASGAGPFGGVGLSGNHRPAGYYSADYCAYPVASVEVPNLTLPEKLSPGLSI